MIPYGRQEITQADIDEVRNVLNSNFLTQGPKVPEFEKAVYGYCGAEYGVAVNSATSALHIACLALGLCPGDRLWTTPITFVASANCGLYCGAKIDFVDIDRQTLNISPKALEEKLIQAERYHGLPKVVIPVHFGGQSCDMEAIHKLSQKYGFSIIEDASHAIGGKYKGNPIGNCRYSDITIFSFHPVKIITTAEGGMAVTNNRILAQKMKLLRSHGITRDPKLMSKEPEGPWYYQQIELGYNYRMNDIQAALGVSQMQRLDHYVSRRHVIVQRYNNALKSLPIKIQFQHPDCFSAYHLYVIRLQQAKSLVRHIDLFEKFRQDGIGVNLHYIPLHTQPYYKQLGFTQGDFPESEKFYSEAMSLPIFPTMSKEQQQHVIYSIKQALLL